MSDDSPGLQCRPMASAERPDVFDLFRSRIHDEAKLGAALNLFVEREDLGMVWVALAAGRAIAACTLSYEIGLREGTVVARIADVVVGRGLDRNLVAKELLTTLRAALDTREIGTIDTEGAFN